MNIQESTTSPRFRLGRRGTRLLLGALGTLAIASTAIGGSLAAASTDSPARPAAVPVKDIVGKGLITCKVATGEVGYTPASQARSTGGLTVSIWFRATHCSAAARGTTPVPRWVIGAMSFHRRRNGCPLLQHLLGTGVLNLTYDYPDAPRNMIDPSVGLKVNVYDRLALWELKGALIGSYPSASFDAWLKPDVIGTQNCHTGITSEYIIRDGTPFVFHV